MGAQSGAELLGVEGGGRLYHMAAAPYARDVRQGVAIDAAVARVDGDWIVVDVQQTRSLRGLELRTYGNLVRLPRDLRIDTSADDAQWQNAFEERPGGLVLRGAVEQPRVMPIRIDLRDVTARYVRVNAPAFGPRSITIYEPRD
jgi:hypothetical protein